MCDSQEDRSVYQEDWGEGLPSRSTPVLCVADIDKGTVLLPEGTPTQVSPGQVSRAMMYPAY